MATFRPPFNAVDLKGLKRAIMKGDFKPLPSSYSKELNDFISMCLKVNPETRPSA
jgi:NIMA (never in mitosis gene a)-related kinase